VTGRRVTLCHGETAGTGPRGALTLDPVRGKRVRPSLKAPMRPTIGIGRLATAWGHDHLSSPKTFDRVEER